MPPSSPSSEEKNFQHGLSPLSDADVAILHEIIATAEQSASFNAQPFRAIFAAYSKILARHGFSPDHDQVYLRFLFKLGERRKPSQSLYESFVAFLDRLGIQILLDDGDGTLQEEDTGVDDIESASVVPEASAVSLGRSRRASFTTLHDIENENAKYGKRNTGRTSFSQVEHSLHMQPGRRSASRPTPRAPGTTSDLQAVHNKDNPPQLDLGRLSADGFANNLVYYPQRQVSASSRGSLEPRQTGRESFKIGKQRVRQRHGGSIGIAAPNYSGYGTMDDTLSNSRSHHEVLSLTEDPQAFLHRPSDTQLLRDADTFEYFRVSSLVRKSFQKWRNLAVEGREWDTAMSQKAAAHDAQTLIRQAYDQWRIGYLDRQQTAETERFFEHLERRAEKARDLHLLTKALTHWAQSASDEVERTAVAHRHILRLRYFSAWRKVTAVNELKVHQFRLWKYLSLWRQRDKQTRANDSKAITVYHANIVESSYWRWFWTFCERRAPEWRNLRLKRQSFLRWISVVSSDVQQNIRATAFRNENIRKQLFAQWLQKTRTVLSLATQVNEFRDRKLLSKHTVVWTLELKYSPIARRVSDMVDWRVAHFAFSTLISRLRLERQALQVDAQRIVRNAWTQWNDQLRMHTLVRQIDDRVLVQALYRWVLAERFVLLRRLNEERLQSSIVEKLQRYRQNLSNEHAGSWQHFIDQHNKQRFALLFRRWKQQTHLRTEQAVQASKVHDLHVLKRSFERFRIKEQHTQQLDIWGVRAAIFFRGRRTLKRWRPAVEESRKKKRRDAYATTRHQINFNLSSRLLSKWYERTVQNRQRDAEVQQQSRYVDLAFATNLFDLWKERKNQVIAQAIQVDQQFAKNSARKYLRMWIYQLQLRKQNNVKARDFAHSHVEKSAYEALRALHLKVLDLRSKVGKAEEWYHWHERRHSHNMLRILHEKFLLKQGIVAEPDISQMARLRARTPRSRRIGMHSTFDALRENPEHAEDVTTALEDDFDLQAWIPTLEAQTSSATPLPGFLSTPSKRAARARALVHGSTTPASPQRLTTPMQRVWRVPPATEPRRLNFDALQRRAFLEDVQEDEPSTPDTR